MFVARYSFDPEYDAQRRWTGYISPTSDDPRKLAEELIDLGMVDLPSQLMEQVEDGEIDDAVDYVLDNEDIRFHEKAGLWMLVHNPRGLSCWPLEAETLDEAIAEVEAQADNLPWHGFGHVTMGNVKYVASITETLHIFECDDTMPEQ